MKNRLSYPWLLAGAVLTAAALLWAAGRAQGQAPKATVPTFKPVAMSIQDGDLLVRFKATWPEGMQGSWDPDAVKSLVARLATVLNGTWAWTPYTPTLTKEPGPVPPGPRIVSFTVDPTEIAPGKSAVLKWETAEATSVRLSCSPADQSSSGTFAVAPLETTSYLLTAMNAAGTNTGNVTLKVSTGPQPTKPVVLLLIHETKNDTRLQALVVNDKCWRDAADGAKCRWLVYDPTEGASHFPNATRAALAKGIPAVVWIDAKSVPTVLKLPDTPEAMEALVKTTLGAKEKKP